MEMEEQKFKKPMSESEFKEYIHNKIEEDFKNGIIHLHTYAAVNKFRSVRRAMRRGLVSPYGDIYPKRPFNNRGNSTIRKGHNSRIENQLKKRIYEQIKSRRQEI